MNRNKFRLKWKNELLILAVLLAIVPALLIGLNLIDTSEEELILKENTILTHTTESLAERINSYFAALRQEQTLVAKSIEDDGLSSKEKVAVLAASVKNMESVIASRLIFIDADENISTAVEVVTEESGRLIDNSIIEKMFIEVETTLISDKNEDYKFINPYFDENSKTWLVSSFLEVNLDLAPKGYLISIIVLNDLEKNVTINSFHQIGNLYITNADGNSILSQNKTSRIPEILKDIKEVLKTNSRATVTEPYDTGDSKLLICYSFPENIRWAVVAELDLNFAYQDIYDKKSLLYTFLFIGLVFAVLVVFAFTHRIRTPIKQLEKMAENVSRGKYDIKTDYIIDDSIGKLGKTMVDMGQSIKQSFAKIEQQKNELEEYSKTLENKVTERTQKLKETNDDLQKSYLKVLELNNEKNEFLGIAAHDLKNPLVAIKGFGSIIVEEPNLPKNELSEFANNIVDSSDRMFKIITRLLDINKIEEGQINIEYSDENVDVLINQIIEERKEYSNSKNISVTYAPHVENYILTTDNNLLHQILDNLLSNAIKFSPLGKNISISSFIEVNNINISVTDKGPGISEEDQKKLFTKFTKLTARPTAGEHSTGLGLSIAMKITELLGGTITVQSELGEGSTFTIKLPL